MMSRCKNYMDDYAKDSGPGEVQNFLPGSFAALTFVSISYEANIDMAALNSFSEPVYSITKPCDVK